MRNVLTDVTILSEHKLLGLITTITILDTVLARRTAPTLVFDIGNLIDISSVPFVGICTCN